MDRIGAAGWPSPRAVIFDLGGTLVRWPDWETDAPRRWREAFDYVVGAVPSRPWPDRDAFAQAMVEAETAHWVRVETEQWSGPPSGLVNSGLRRLGLSDDEGLLMAILDGYARAVDGWAIVFDDARPTLHDLRSRGYRLGLLSNTWWAADWHNRDLATHGLAELLDEVSYTSDLPHSKPNPSVFLDVAARLRVEPTTCVMVGDRLIDDVGGAAGAGMRGIWKHNDSPFPGPASIKPAAVVTRLAEIPGVLRAWGEALQRVYWP